MAIAAENLDKHIYELLAADSTLTALIPGGIHDEVAPADTVCPHLVLISYLPGVDRHLMGAVSKRAWTSFGKLVKSVTEGDSFAVNFRIMARAEILLAGTHAGLVLGVYKANEVRYIEQDGDRRWNHYGYIYRAIARDG